MIPNKKRKVTFGSRDKNVTSEEAQQLHHKPNTLTSPNYDSKCSSWNQIYSCSSFFLAFLCSCSKSFKTLTDHTSVKATTEFTQT